MGHRFPARLAAGSGTVTPPVREAVVAGTSTSSVAVSPSGRTSSFAAEWAVPRSERAADFRIATSPPSSAAGKQAGASSSTWDAVFPPDRPRMDSENWGEPSSAVPASRIPTRTHGRHCSSKLQVAASGGTGSDSPNVLPSDNQLTGTRAAGRNFSFRNACPRATEPRTAGVFSLVIDTTDPSVVDAGPQARQRHGVPPPTRLDAHPRPVSTIWGVFPPAPPHPPPVAPGSAARTVSCMQRTNRSTVSWRDYTVETGYRPQIARDIARSAAACRAAVRLTPFRQANVTHLSQAVAAGLTAARSPGPSEPVVLDSLTGALERIAETHLVAAEEAVGAALGVAEPVPVRDTDAQLRALEAGTGAKPADSDNPVAALLTTYPSSPTVQAVTTARRWVAFQRQLADGTVYAALRTSYLRGSPRPGTASRTAVEETARTASNSGLDGAALADAAVRFESLKHYRLVWLRVDRTVAAGTYDDVHPDDLFSHGYLGLLRALHRYDPAREAFSTYAMYRINGAIRDGMRAESPIPKRASTQLRKVNSAVETLTQQLQRTPTPSEVCQAVDLSLAKLEELQRLQAPRPLTPPDEDGEEPVRNPTVHLVDHGSDPSVLVEDRVLADALRTAVSTLPSQQRAAVELLVLEECTLAEASQRTGMTTSVLRRAKREALGELRTSLHQWQ